VQHQDTGQQYYCTHQGYHLYVTKQNFNPFK